MAACLAGAAVVCIHGGGFRAGKRESYDVLCQKLAERAIFEFLDSRLKAK